jgi:hypothetical protein
VAVRIPLIPSPVGVVPVDVARAGLRDCADHAVYFALLILIFKVPLLEKVFERIAGLNTAIWVLFFGVLIFLSWWFSRHRPPRDTSVYARRQRTTLSFLILGNLVGILWAGNEDLPIPSFMWISSIAMYCVAAIGLVEIHRTSTLRRFWRKEARGWLWLVLSVEAGLLLALGTAFFAPWLLALEPLAACCLLIMGVAYAYLASRQPAVGGISS